MHHSWDLRIPWRRGSSEWDHAHHRISGGHHVRVDRSVDLHPANYGERENTSTFRQQVADLVLDRRWSHKSCR